MHRNIAVIFAFVFAYSIAAGRLERTPFGGAILFTAFGLVCGPLGLGILTLRVEAQGLRTLAELALALVLFTDAAGADLGVLRRNLGLPERLLLVGLPLTILLGGAVGAVVFPHLAPLELAILGTMLAPTDAALGKPAVVNKAVPAPIREGLNVESGLNDGICAPVLPVLLALAGSGLRPEARLFVGWFGPRGLFSVVFAVIVLDAHLPGGEILTATVACTVILSILAHGLTASPLVAALARRHAKGAAATRSP
jgi:NhaP-type Na+/H+ or K+/H+ antiporter